MLSREELLKMREMTFEDIDPKEIQDVEKLKIDVKKSKPEKVREILESGKNPYFLKYKGITIKIGFALFYINQIGRASCRARGC